MLDGVTDAWGIIDGFHDVAGEWHPTSAATRDALRAVIGDPAPSEPCWFVAEGSEPDLLGACHVLLEDGTEVGPVGRLPPDIPIGYHSLRPLDGGVTTFLVVHPPSAPAAPSVWGLSAQVYSLRSAGSQGIGDLADLGALLRWAHRHGAGAVLLSPLHAPSPTYPQQDSPYYPSSRRWWNPLHLRVPGLPADDAPTFVERDEVWRRKRSALLSWFIMSAIGDGWRRWVTEQGESLHRYAVWCTLAERHGPRWTEWPADVRHPDGPGVTALDPDDIDVAFHSWCQWLIGRQLAEARRSARDVSLIGDLAVGFDSSGADAWAFQDQLAFGCRIGAPPDMFNPAGQDWGLPPFIPSALRTARYRPFIDTVRAAMRGFSGLRIDHIMGLFRQWWIPPGASPDEGAYVRFPADELLAIVRIEATRAGVFVIGEDLGTVEAGVREALAGSGILGTRVGWFEADAPARWPEECLATLTTHDLPTVAGVWQGRDGTPALLARLEDLTGSAPGALTDDVVLSAHEALAGSPARLRLATLEDLCSVTDRPNVPGTTIEYPNWRRRLPLRIEEFDASTLVRACVDAFAAPPRPVEPPE